MEKNVHAYFFLRECHNTKSVVELKGLGLSTNEPIKQIYLNFFRPDIFSYQVLGHS